MGNYKYCNKKYKPWTDEDVVQLEILYKTHTVKQIAELTGRTKDSVQRKIYLCDFNKVTETAQRPVILHPNKHTTVHLSTSRY